MEEVFGEIQISRTDYATGGEVGEVRVTVDRLLLLTCNQRLVFIVHSQLVEF
jgi:hypothetical protein